MRAIPVLALFAALTALWASGPAAAQAVSVPQSAAEIKLSFAPIVKKVAPAVVNVYGAKVEKVPRNPLLDDPFFRRFFGGGDGPAPDRVQRSLGSGVIVDSTGLVITNHHVIENMTDVKVSLADKREFEAEIVLRDPRTDLAVLKLKTAEKFPWLELDDSDAIEVGDLVLAVGNPFGVGQTVTQGIVSALARTQVGVSDYQFFIQTDAAINPGNSGGALIDMAGKLVGINTAIYSQSGGSHGIGFAIPANMVKVVVASAKAGSKSVRRPWFGARLQTVSPDIADSLGLERPTGALIASMMDKSPALESGLKTGDVVLAVDGQGVEDPDGFGYRFGMKPLGGTTTLTVLRGGSRTSVRVKLVTAPESRPRDPVKLKGRWPLAGLTVVNISPAVAEELSIDFSSDGVAVAEVDDTSPAASVGLKKGDIILAIDGEKIPNTRELSGYAERPRQYFWRITISRNGQVTTSILGG
jgi:Do/DeqQ family serine protease